MRFAPRRSAVLFALPALITALAGCQVPREAQFPDVQKWVQERTGKQIRWRQGTEEDAAVEKAVQALLAKELSVEAAVEVALLNNPALQAAYEELGVTQAEVVQAGLLKNPVFGAGADFGISPVKGTDIALNVVQDFLDLLTLPARKRLAQMEFDTVKLRVGSQVVAFAAETRAAYYDVQGAQNTAAILRTVAEAARASFEFAQALSRAGNLSDLDLARDQALYEQARLELVRAETEVQVARERLTQLMGLFGQQTTWRIPERLPELPPADPALDRLESLAIERRLDVTAARSEVALLEASLAFARTYRFVGDVQVGADAEREAEEGGWRVGPSVSLALPIFDQGQARVARLEALVRQSQWRLTDLSIRARSEVRTARYRLLAARDIVKHYRDVLVPVWERIVALSHEQYNFMLIGTFELLEAKRNEIETYAAYVRAVRDYWLARSELERVTGGRLPGEAAGK